MSVATLAHGIGRLAIWSVVLAGAIGLGRFRQLTPPQRYLALLACFDVAMELTALLVIPLFHLKSNLFLFPLISLGEIGLLALAYRAALQSATFSRVMPWLVGAFGVCALFDCWVEFHRVHYPVAILITADLLQFGFAILYFWKLLRELRVGHLQQDPFFWVSVGLVVFVLGDLLIMLFSNYLLAHYARTLQVLIIDVVRPCFLIALYCCYSLALWMHPPKPNLFSS